MAAQLTLPNHPHLTAFILILLVTYMRPSEFLAWTEISCPTAFVTSPMSVGRNRSYRNWCVYQDRSPRGTGPHGPTLASAGQQAPAPTQRGESGRENLDYPAAAKLFTMATDALHDHVPNTSQKSRHRSGTRFQNSARSPKTRSVECLRQCRKIHPEQSPTDSHSVARPLRSAHPSAHNM